jgi:hypothetical protein
MVLGSFIAIDALGTIFVSSSEISRVVKMFGAAISLLAAFSLVLGGYYLKNYKT